MNTLFPTVITSKKMTETDSLSAKTASWIDELFNSFDHDGFLNSSSTMKMPPVNVLENAHGYELHMALPGYSKADFKIDVDKQRICIASEKEDNKDEAACNYSRREFSVAGFKRIFELPKVVDKDQISATYTDGVLKISMPKLEEVKHEDVRQIEIS